MAQSRRVLRLTHSNKHQREMTLEQLKSFREKHVDYMLDFVGLDDEEADRYRRYVGYINRAIEKRQS